jgi:hypothetical protein
MQTQTQTQTQKIGAVTRFQLMVSNVFFWVLIEIGVQRFQKLILGF